MGSWLKLTVVQDDEAGSPTRPVRFAFDLGAHIAHAAVDEEHDPPRAEVEAQVGVREVVADALEDGLVLEPGAREWAKPFASPSKNGRLRPWRTGPRRTAAASARPARLCFMVYLAPISARATRTGGRPADRRRDHGDDDQIKPGRNFESGGRNARACPRRDCAKAKAGAEGEQTRVIAHATTAPAMMEGQDTPVPGEPAGPPGATTTVSIIYSLRK